MVSEHFPLVFTTAPGNKTAPNSNTKITNPPYSHLIFRNSLVHPKIHFDSLSNFLEIQLQSRKEKSRSFNNQHGMHALHHHLLLILIFRIPSMWGCRNQDWLQKNVGPCRFKQLRGRRHKRRSIQTDSGGGHRTLPRTKQLGTQKKIIGPTNGTLWRPISFIAEF